MTQPSVAFSLANRYQRRGLTLLFGFGVMTFFFMTQSASPEKIWRSLLINVLFFSAIAQGAMLFSVIMHVTKAKWSGPLSSISESFSSFFPISFFLFLILYAGKKYLFPWLDQDLHGKEIWLNIPFLFTRDLIGLFILYLCGFAYTYHSLWFKLKDSEKNGRIKQFLMRRWHRIGPDMDRYGKRKTFFGILYIFFFAVVLSLIGFDWLMSMDPHWYSTLFGGYTFVKAIYVGFGALIILSSIMHMKSGISFRLESSQFHDIGKLFFAFCLLWADFFYCQFVVIWYGNIPEETVYIIERIMHPPWQTLSLIVFSFSFIIPFIVLINKSIKTKPIAMIVICSVAIAGIWFEHLLILGPVYSPQAETIAIGIEDVLLFLGFIGLFSLCLIFYLHAFPELMTVEKKETE